jgi:plasmid stabilization system protein ParE
MAKTIEYVSDARVDFDESFDWYAKHSVGAAIGFASAVDEAIDKILANPSQFFYIWRMPLLRAQPISISHSIS